MNVASVDVVVVSKMFLSTVTFIPPVTVSSQMSLCTEKCPGVLSVTTGKWISVNATCQWPGNLYTSGYFTIKCPVVLEGKYVVESWLDR